MELYKSEIDSCTGSKTISILSFKRRALFAIGSGYLSIFYIIFNTDYEIANRNSVIHECNIDRLNEFLNEELSLLEKIHYYIIDRTAINFIKDRMKKFKIEDGKERKSFIN